jgi:hypothetical protein
MAFVMEYTDGRGVTHPQSYWLPVLVNTAKIDQLAKVVFYGYHDQATRESKLMPVGIKEYAVAPEQYEQYFNAAEISQAGVNELSQAYQLAKNTLEGETPKEGEADTRTGFFANAQDA